MAVQNSNRRYDLDWLRVIAFSILILFHSGMMFNTWDWHIKNNVTTDSPELLMYFLHQWRMPLLFLISGAAAYVVLQKFSVMMFLKNRMTRLFLPLVFGLFIVIPPQVYYERLFYGQVFNSFFDYYKTIFSFLPYPEGNFSWHHLWYIPYIFTFSIALLPLLKSLQSEKGRSLLQKMMNRFASGGMIVLWFLPLGLSQVILRPFWPNDNQNLFNDWSNFSWTIIFFLYGFLLMSHRNIWETIQRLRFRFLLTGLGSFVVLLVCREHFEYFTEVDRALYRMLRGLHAWNIVLSILGFAHKYLHRNSPILRYANEAVYPLYILHQTITVIIAFYVGHWNMNLALKFVLVSAGTILGCWSLYEGLIKRNNILRILFGMKAVRYHEEQSITLQPTITVNETIK